MSRKPRSTRLPPRLPDPERERPPRDDSGPSLRQVLKQQHVAGRSVRFGRAETIGTMRRVAQNAPGALVGLANFPGITQEQVEVAVAAVYGWAGDGPRARIAPRHTIEGFTAAVMRVLEVARGGGRLAFATARPASLLPVYRRLAARAGAEGAEILTAEETGGFGPGNRRVRWIDHVAVLTDGAALLADDSVEAAEEWLFAIARPDLVVADHQYAGVASATGLEVVAFADLDAVALAVAAWLGRAVRVVPLDDRRPPPAYAALLDLLETLASVEVDPLTASGAPAQMGS